MNTNEIKQSILAGDYNNFFAKIFSDVSLAQNRYAKACDEFVKLYGVRDEMRLFSASTSVIFT